MVRKWFSDREQRRLSEIKQTGDNLTRALAFLSTTYGEGQEMVLFLTELSAGYDSLKFISECGNASYTKYNRLLLLKDRRRELDEEVRAIELGDGEE